MEPFTEEWWEKIEGGKVEKAENFGPDADVVSIFAARIMVIAALQDLELLVVDE